VDADEDDDLPSSNDEQVQSVPCVGQVRSTPDKTHRHHLDGQFDGEEGEDEVIEAFEDAAACRLADLVLTWTVHPERHAVQQDHAHADPLKPRNISSQGRSTNSEQPVQSKRHNKKKNN